MNDPFLSDLEAEARLYGDWTEHNGIIIAYDFDNTIFDFHGIGDQYPAVMSLLRECDKYGCKFICFTARHESDHPMVMKHILKHRLPCDGINVDLINFETGRKPYYNILLDDRAGLKSAFESLTIVLNKIKEIY